IGAVLEGPPGTGTKLLTLTSLSGSGDPNTDSEYRIAGIATDDGIVTGDTKGRIVGFGMGPNVIIGGGTQPGGITYGDMEVLLVNLGRGDDTVIVDYTTNAEDHT